MKWMYATGKVSAHPKLAWTLSLSALPFFAVAVVLFRTEIFGNATLIGNADRLNHMLAFARFHADHIRNGTFAFWDSLMFGGLDATALNFNVFSLLYALVPPEFFMAATMTSAVIQLAVAGILMHAALRAFGLSRPAAICAAVCYQCSALVLLQVTQHDFTFLVLMLSPGAWWAVRSIAPNRILKPFLGLVCLFVPMAALGFLQSAIYVMAFVGLYALWRSTKLRRPEPAVTTALAGLVANLAAVPRLMAVISEKATLVRASPTDFLSIFEFQNVRFWEILRLAADGILGRFPSEAAELGNNINLTEGMLLGNSAAAAGLALTGVLMLASSRWRRALSASDAPVMAGFVLFGVLTIAAWPVGWLLYHAFLKSDLLHARILVAAAFPLHLLIGAALDVVMDRPSATAKRRGNSAILAAAAIGCAIGLAAPTFGSWIGDPLEVNRYTPFNGRTFGPPAPILTTAPTNLTARRVAPDTVQLSWDFSGEALGFSIGMDAGYGFKTIGFIAWPHQAYRIGSIAPHIGYRFAVRACNTSKCFGGLAVTVPPHEPDSATLYSSAGEPPLSEPVLNEAPRDHMLVPKPAIAVATVIVGGITLLALGFGIFFRHGRDLRLEITAGIMGLAVSNALIIADHKLNGPHLWWTGQTPAFNRGNSMLAPRGDFIPPDSGSPRCREGAPRQRPLPRRRPVRSGRFPYLLRATHGPFLGPSPARRIRSRRSGGSCGFSLAKRHPLDAGHDVHSTAGGLALDASRDQQRAIRDPGHARGLPQPRRRGGAGPAGRSRRLYGL